jgi:hypothetical protein
VLFDRTGRVEEAAAACAELTGTDIPVELDPLMELACA